MNKWQALQAFFSGFQIPAYAGHAPSAAEYPYLTYTPVSGHYQEGTARVTASLWYRSETLKDIDLKADEIAAALPQAGALISVDGGYIRLFQAPTFAQPMNEPDDDKVRRIVLSIDARFLTAT